MIVNIEHVFLHGDTIERHYQSIECETLNEAEMAANNYKKSPDLTPAQRKAWILRRLYTDKFILINR